MLTRFSLAAVAHVALSDRIMLRTYLNFTPEVPERTNFFCSSSLDFLGDLTANVPDWVLVPEQVYFVFY